MDAEINDLIVGIYQLIDTVPLERFKASTFDLVAKIIPVRAALWGDGLATFPPVVHSLYLYNLPEEGMATYAPYAKEDVLYHAVLANPNRTIRRSDLISRQEYEASEMYCHHGRRWRTEWAMSSSMVDPELELYTIISLYRSFDEADFSDREKSLKQLLIPHMVNAYRIKLFRESLAVDASAERFWDMAIVDSRGAIHHASPGLIKLLRKHWKDWRGPYLPKEVMDRLSGEPPWFFIDSFYFSLSPLRESLMFMKCKDTNCLKNLGVSECKVAFLLSLGWSYKEVSRGLGISPSTVTNHVNHIYSKLNIASKNELRHLFLNL